MFIGICNPKLVYTRDTWKCRFQQVKKRSYSRLEASASCSRPLLTSCKQKCSISYSKSNFQNKEDGRLLACPSGGAKRLLAEKGYDFDMATPVVITGEHHQVRHNTSGQIILIPFDTEFGSFFVEICFEPV